MTLPSKHISISIKKPAAEVYDFASDPQNLPQWATGLSDSLKKVGDDWIADSPTGKITIKFAEKNTFGVLDHDVTLPSGATFYNPMRVFPNGDGSEVVFTLYRQPNMTTQAFLDDKKTIEKDLKKLKVILEE